MVFFTVVYLHETDNVTDKINAMLLLRLNKPTNFYKSVDTVIDRNEAIHYPTKFLYSLSPPGTILHKLILKVGSSIILLWNVYSPKLCNATRLQIKCLKKLHICVLVITGWGNDLDR